MPKIMKAHMRQPRISKHLVKHHIFCTIDSSVENSEQELIKQLKELARQRDELNQDSPPIADQTQARAPRPKIALAAEMYPQKQKNPQETMASHLGTKAEAAKKAR